MTDPGCPRCRDYEDLKRELENQKERFKEKQNKDLLSCEKEKKLLQKRALQLGAAAVIGGTILGKEFVDNVASYIESFNSVLSLSDAGSSPPVDLVSTVPPVDTPAQDPTPDPTNTPQNKNPVPAKYFYMATIDPTQSGFGGSVAYDDLLFGYDQEFDLLSGNEPDDPMEYLRRLTRAFSEVQEESFELTLPSFFDYGMEDEMLKIEDPEYIVISENFAFVPLAALPVLFYRRRRK